MNPEKVIYTKDLYQYYLDCLNTGLTMYRESEDNIDKIKWLQFAHRATALTDLYRRLKEHHERQM